MEGGGLAPTLSPLKSLARWKGDKRGERGYELGERTHGEGRVWVLLYGILPLLGNGTWFSRRGNCVEGKLVPRLKDGGEGDSAFSLGGEHAYICDFQLQKTQKVSALHLIIVLQFFVSLTLEIFFVEEHVQRTTPQISPCTLGKIDRCGGLTGAHRSPGKSLLCLGTMACES